MKRLTDTKTAETVKQNAEGLIAKGLKPSVSDLIYIKLAEYEDSEENSKRLKQLLMEAVDGFKALGRELDEKCELNLPCEKCPLQGGSCRKWKHADEALKLIGGK